MMSWMVCALIYICLNRSLNTFGIFINTDSNHNCTKTSETFYNFNTFTYSLAMKSYLQHIISLFLPTCPKSNVLILHLYYMMLAAGHLRPCHQHTWPNKNPLIIHSYPCIKEHIQKEHLDLLRKSDIIPLTVCGQQKENFYPHNQVTINPKITVTRCVSP